MIHIYDISWLKNGAFYMDSTNFALMSGRINTREFRLLMTRYSIGHLMGRLPKAILISWCFSTCSFLYAAELRVDFGDQRQYVNSLNAVRVALGDPVSLPNIPVGRILYQLRPDASNIVEGDVVEIIGVDREDQNPDLRLVMKPSDLYLTGFIVGRVFYRFSDFAGSAGGRAQVNAPRRLVNSTVNLAVESGYLSLTRIAGIREDRTDLSIDRNSLKDGYKKLMKHGSSTKTINKAEAKALLSYATVLSEAIRFRSIQGKFAGAALGRYAYVPYRLSAEDSQRTVRWGRLSDEIRSVKGGATEIGASYGDPIPVKEVRDIFGMISSTMSK
ncbi:ribosome-inactivating family protein [Paraburkholderia youngii]|uniref:ribosome-inactivating family protein n=1 Tax=Paraburkholderia youngii TaxID=2782701 RepID=UPI003D2547E4